MRIQLSRGRRREDRAAADRLVEPPFQILLHSGTVRGKLRHLDHHGEFFTSACAEVLDHAEEFIVGAPPTRRPPIASWEPRRLLSSTPVPEFISGNAR